MDIFERIKQNNGPIGELQKWIEGSIAFPKLKGSVSNHITFNNKKTICWSYNNYLGLATSTEVNEIDSFAQSESSMTYPMGSRMMTGDTYLHDEFEMTISFTLSKESITDTIP